MNRYTIAWAAPTSQTAERHDAPTGCWVVQYGETEAAFATRDAAQAHADTLKQIGATATLWSRRPI